MKILTNKNNNNKSIIDLWAGINGSNKRIVKIYSGTVDGNKLVYSRLSSESPSTPSTPPSTECVHDYKIINYQEAYCTPGWVQYECTKCTNTYTESIPVTEPIRHISANEYKSVEPTCWESGEMVVVCAECGTELDRYEIPKLSHEADSNGLCIHCGLPDYKW